MSYQRMREVIPTLEAEIAQIVAEHGETDRHEELTPAVPTDRW